MMEKNAGDSAVAKDWLELPALEGAANKSSDTISSDSTMTPLELALPESGEQTVRPGKKVSPTSEAVRPSNASEYYPFITLTSTGNTLSESIGGTSSSTQTSSPPTSVSTANLGAKSPSSTHAGFFANFRPSSPKIQLPYGSSSTTRDEIGAFYSSAIGRKGAATDRERDISQSSSDPSTRNRRPSSVFDHVGGMLDRFGRRLHSRGEAERRRMSNSVVWLNESAVDVGESGSSVDDHSPNESISQISPTTNQPPNWDKSIVERGPGLSWSPVMDEGRRSRPDMTRNESAGSSGGEGSTSRPGGHSSLHHAANRVSVMERTLVQVTEDNERFSVVDISGLNSAAAIKERMMSKLHRFEEDPSCFAMSKTEIGMSGPGGPTLDNDELLALCWQQGDERGSLKFLLHQVSPPSHPNHSMLPPPRYSNLIPLLGLHENGIAPAPALHLRTTTHSKSGSFSSRSSAGDALNHADTAVTGDSGSDASGRIGVLHRVRAASRRVNGSNSAASTDESRSPITSTRSPSQPTTPLLASLLELETSEKNSTPITTSKRPSRPEKSESRQSQSGSPIEENDESTLRSAGVRRSGNGSTRPSSSHPALRTSLNSQSESEGGQRNSQISSAVLSPMMSKSDLPERRSSEKASTQLPSEERVNGSLLLPKSLQPGGRDPRGIDAADAAHMYLCGSSSPLEPTPAREGSSNHQQQQQQQQQQPQAVHNARSVDDMQRRSRAAVLSSMQEMPILNRDQLMSSGQRSGNISASAIIRQGSADRSQSSYGQQDPRDPRFNNTTAMIARPRSSHGPERERAASYTESPYHRSMNMVGRPGGPHIASFDGGRIPRPGMLTSPPMMPRPMTSGSMRPVHHDNRPYITSNQANFRPLHFTNEFGARVSIPQLQGQHYPLQHSQTSDPRLIKSPPFTAPPRPLTFQDHQRFRPIVLPPGYGRAGPPLPQFREDPFTSSQFPASNSRTVSEFQRNPTSALQPGMTVQETMQRQRQLAMARSAQQLRSVVDPRESRSMSVRPVYVAHPSPHHGPVSAPPPRPSNQQQYQYNSVDNHHASVRQQPTAPLRTSNQNPPLAAPLTRPHTAALDEWNPPPNERSSGSSFATASSSHKRNLSLEDRQSAGWVEEAYSAPTSARSSRSESMEKGGKLQVTNASSPGSTAMHSELPYSDHIAKESQRRNSMPEDDLSHLRPLPKLPPLVIAGSDMNYAKSASAGTENRYEDESTIRAAEWKQMLISLEAEGENGEDSGTVKALGHGRFKQSEIDASKSSGVSSSKTAVPLRNENITAAEAEDGGTFASFASFDDEEEYDEGGTWAQPLDDFPKPSKLPLQSIDTSADEAAITMRPGGSFVNGPRSPNSPHSPRTMGNSPRRPILTLSIDPTVHGSPSLVEAVSPKSVSAKVNNHLRPDSSKDSPQPGGSLVMPSPSTDINRRTSFAKREVDWAFRPPPEQLYDNLDAFFPKHDLDKPVLDNALPGSPHPTSPKAEVRATSPAPLSSNRARFTHKKSIRNVAQDRKKFLEKPEVSERRRTSDKGLNRKRSTKLWGTTVVEVTPSGAATSISSTGVASPSTEAGARPVFKWVKGDLIGKGTYGRVYLALNATTGEMIAVKQVELPMTDSDREDARQKGVVSALKSEIETLKDLDHPNIVSYLGFEETTRYLSIFLEYVPGGSVGSCLRKHGKLDEATIKSFLQQILGGLNYLHKRGILHRDLKADNLLVDFNGIVKISDFGTVRRSEDIYGNIASMSIQGSIFWMAPEVVSLSRAGYSAKVDIWSLGCVVLEMFAGRRPWSDEEAVQAMFKIGAERKPPPIPPDAILSRPATHFLKVCFAVDPASRPTAQRLLDHVFPHPEPGWNFSESSLYQALHR